MADKSAKAGRNSNKCKAYRLAQRREINTLHRQARHAKRRGWRPADFPADLRAAWDKLMAALPNTVINRVLKEANYAA